MLTPKTRREFRLSQQMLMKTSQMLHWKRYQMRYRRKDRALGAVLWSIRERGLSLCQISIGISGSDTGPVNTRKECPTRHVLAYVSSTSTGVTPEGPQRLQWTYGYTTQKCPKMSWNESTVSHCVKSLRGDDSKSRLRIPNHPQLLQELYRLCG